MLRIVSAWNCSTFLKLVGDLLSYFSLGTMTDECNLYHLAADCLSSIADKTEVASS